MVDILVFALSNSCFDILLHRSRERKIPNIFSESLKPKQKKKNSINDVYDWTREGERENDGKKDT